MCFSQGSPLLSTSWGLLWRRWTHNTALRCSWNPPPAPSHPESPRKVLWKSGFKLQEVSVCPAHRTYLGAWPAVFPCHTAKKKGSLCFPKTHTSYSLSCTPWLLTQESSRRAGQVQLLSPRLWGWGAVQVFGPMPELLIPQKYSKSLTKA